MNYFKDCKTAEDVKATFKKLCKELHPDMNPGKDTTAAFQAMYNEYETAFNSLKNVHVNSKGETYTRTAGTTETPKEYADLIIQLLKIPGLIVELCGAWLWITGDTYENRETLKALHFKFSSKKSAWYYHRDPYKKHSKKEFSLNDIRNRFGSVTFERSNDPDPDTLPA